MRIDLPDRPDQPGRDGHRRPRLGARREQLDDLPYHRTFWHLPIPDGAHPCDNTLPSGLSVATVEPMRSYRLRYDDAAELQFDLSFDAVVDAQPFHVSNGMGHLDQLGRVTGELELHGERRSVDCIEMRDRSWTPRRETTSRTRRGYAYAASDDGRRGFFVATSVPPGGGDDDANGWLLADGAVTPIDGGRREVARDDRHRPTGVYLELHAGDRTERWQADVRSRLALPTTPYFAWMSLTAWTGSDGATAWGEDHDSW